MPFFIMIQDANCPFHNLHYTVENGKTIAVYNCKTGVPCSDKCKLKLTGYFNKEAEAFLKELMK